MREVREDIFEYCKREKPDALCIMTNGYVKNDGACVMGRGLAKQAADRWPELPKLLGAVLKSSGKNAVHKLVQKGGIWIVSYPTKETWQTESRISFVRRSALELLLLVDAEGWKHVALPRPGCGNGLLSWNEKADSVEETIAPLLDDRFVVVDTEGP
jgi:O-acetyl-ADP-ribose deacetylase (regulator of RNase III)